MNTSSLSRHLVDHHKIYQQMVVAKELLEDQAGMSYWTTTLPSNKLACPFPGCVEELGSGWMLRLHFRDLHPKDLVTAPKECLYPSCKNCSMQVNPSYPRHIHTEECAMGMAQMEQQEAAVASALALCRQFIVHRDALDRVKVIKYLGRMLAQDNNTV
jgi:hypothetical protein